MASGKLVSDAAIIKLVKERIKQADCVSGFLLDGFPRTTTQADALRDEAVKIDYVIEIDVPDEEIIERMSGRLVHSASGRIYHRIYNPPKVAGKDDMSGDALVQREDDREETVRQRLAVYRQQTRPLIDYYYRWGQSGDTSAPAYHSISGVGTMAEVRDRLFEILGESVLVYELR